MRRTAACLVLAAVLLMPTTASAAQGLRTNPISWLNVLMRALVKAVATVSHSVVGGGTEGLEGPSPNSSITIDPYG